MLGSPSAKSKKSSDQPCPTTISKFVASVAKNGEPCMFTTFMLSAAVDVAKEKFASSKLPSRFKRINASNQPPLADSSSSTYYVLDFSIEINRRRIRGLNFGVPPPWRDSFPICLSNFLNHSRNPRKAFF